MQKKKYVWTDYEKAQFEVAFETMKSEGFFDKLFTNGTTPYQPNNDPIGSRNFGFFMWQAAREDVIEYVLNMVQNAADMDEVLRKLLAMRANSALQHYVEEQAAAGFQ